MNSHTEASWTKLEDGTWGIKVNSKRTLSEGSQVMVTRRDGSSSFELVGIMIDWDKFSKTYTVFSVEDDVEEIEDDEDMMEEIFAAC